MRGTWWIGRARVRMRVTCVSHFVTFFPSLNDFGKSQGLKAQQLYLYKKPLRVAIGNVGKHGGKRAFIFISIWIICVEDVGRVKCCWQTPGILLLPSSIVFTWGGRTRIDTWSVFLPAENTFNLSAAISTYYVGHTLKGEPLSSLSCLWWILQQLRCSSIFFGRHQ